MLFAVHAVVVCLSVRPSVCRTVPKRVNLGSRKQQYQTGFRHYLGCAVLKGISDKIFYSAAVNWTFTLASVSIDVIVMPCSGTRFLVPKISAKLRRSHL